jgi:hypothetical protein
MTPRSWCLIATPERSRGPVTSTKSLGRERCVEIHLTDCNPQPPCSISSSRCTSRHTGAAKRNAMDIIATVMLGSIVLYMFVQMTDLAD